MLKCGEEHVERGQRPTKSSNDAHSFKPLRRLAGDLGVELISKETGETLG
jgi:hypothetical protein